jgi:hypothetical protein
VKRWWLTYLEQVEQLAEEALGVFTSLGVAKAPFEQVADLLECLCDDLEEVAVRKGSIGQLL